MSTSINDIYKTLTSDYYHWACSVKYTTNDAALYVNVITCRRNGISEKTDWHLSVNQNKEKTPKNCRNEILNDISQLNEWSWFCACAASLLQTVMWPAIRDMQTNHCYMRFKNSSSGFLLFPLVLSHLQCFWSFSL